MKRIHGARWAIVLCAAVIAGGGCNMITGADTLTTRPAATDGTSDGNNDDPGTGGASTVDGSGGNIDVGGGHTGGGDVAPAPMAYADGVTLTDIDLYQAIRRPVVEDGQAAASDIPIVAGKDALMRIFYTTDSSYDGTAVTARLTVADAEPFEVTQSLSGNSSHQQLGSTINLDVPGELLTAGADFKVELLQPEESTSGNNSSASFPPDGVMTSLGVEQGAVKLKILLVPVSHDGTLPDTSPDQVQKYHQWFSERYPVPEVEVNVRSSPYTYNGYLGGYSGWSSLLDDITDLRDYANAPNDVYYYGIHDASGSGLLGLGWIGGSNDVWSRTAIGVGWTGTTAPETAVHELGHNHGRGHSPCGVSGDPSYPHSGAKIGVWGYHPGKKQLLDPNDYVDFMSYCDPAWISDYNFKAIFKRAKTVSSQPYIQTPPNLLNRTYERITVLNGQAFFKDEKTLTLPPRGNDKTVSVSTNDGKVDVTGQYFQYDHIEGGLLYVMRPAQFTGGHWIQHIDFSAEGHAFSLSR